MHLPDFVVHADWGSSPGKRQKAVAERENDNNYVVRPPEGVEDVPTFRDRLAQQAVDSRIVVGFDFPIGIPDEYARRADILSFLDALSEFGEGQWDKFYKRAERPSEISLRRPFYPRNPGRSGVKQSHLLEGLGITDKNKLLRRCERKTEQRGKASMLFWLVGPKQAGNAARIGWERVLAPLQDSDTPMRFWPFDGEMESLLEEEGLVAAETYPAEAGHHLGLDPHGWSKSSQEDRKVQSRSLFKWAATRSVRFTPGLRDELSKGFGQGKHGEDRFDTIVGLGSMIEVLLGHRREGAPQDSTVRNVEGWIFGQTSSI